MAVPSAATPNGEAYLQECLCRGQERLCINSHLSPQGFHNVNPRQADLYSSRQAECFLGHMSLYKLAPPTGIIPSLNNPRSTITAIASLADTCRALRCTGNTLSIPTKRLYHITSLHTPTYQEQSAAAATTTHPELRSP